MAKLLAETELLEFADQETARETARLARAALFDPANAEPAPPEANGAGAMTSASGATGPLAEIRESMTRPITRRDLLHGRLSGGSDVPRR